MNHHNTPYTSDISKTDYMWKAAGFGRRENVLQKDFCLWGYVYLSSHRGLQLAYKMLLNEMVFHLKMFNFQIFHPPPL